MIYLFQLNWILLILKKGNKIAQQNNDKKITDPGIMITIISMLLIMGLGQIISSQNLNLPMRILLIIIGSFIISFSVAGIYFLIKKIINKK